MQSAGIWCMAVLFIPPEVVVADLAGMRFARMPDATTGYKELSIWSAD